MKVFVDGDQLVITRDDFDNLQDDPALFVPLASVEALLDAGEYACVIVPEAMFNGKGD